MENKEIIEGNKLVAEFDGWVIDNSFPDKDRTYIKNGGIELDTTFKYHTSWDWLMPVVEKIFRMKIGDGIEYVEYPFLRTFGMLNNHKCSSHKTEEPDGKIMVRLNGFSVFKSDSLIEATFLSVVEFIKWYNENKNN